MKTPVTSAPISEMEATKVEISKTETPAGNQEVWVMIRVTQAHIAQGRAGTCRLCPIALAVMEVLYRGYYVEVMNDEVRIYRVGEYRFAHAQPLNGVPCQLISQFDCGHSVAPVEFPLSLPAYLLRREVREQAAVEWKEHLERLESQCGLTRAEEYEQAAMRG